MSICIEALMSWSNRTQMLKTACWPDVTVMTAGLADGWRDGSTKENSTRTSSEGEAVTVFVQASGQQQSDGPQVGLKTVEEGIPGVPVGIARILGTQRSS